MYSTAFHSACPITCRKICYCEEGFPPHMRSKEARDEFDRQTAILEQFIKDPWLIKSRQNATVQVMVPKVVRTPDSAPAPAPPQRPEGPTVDGKDRVEDEAAMAAASAQVKRVSLQKKAAATSMAAEDYARKFESGDLSASVQDTAGEEQNQSNAKVMCRLCFSGENEGSERARKMLSCNNCGKKYHGSCLKSWSQNRDLFHWSSWTCPSCRICEVCRRTGDPNKFMFCKRCDGAYHCYCQQPPHKNVGHGPYLCPKHTKCHSCGSSVPGNGLSVRWFLGYTCCDACGRLFVKGNYCPVCLKVYRDSESTPMVCCDICQRWVHCPCDGISDAKYMQFQVDGNLQYVCPTCRGECHQVRNLEEAVQELWRRRDEADKHDIASLRAAAGLPTQEEIFDISPFSDDDEIGSSKNEYSRSLKLSLKGLGEKSPKKSKEYGKKASKKKYGKKKSPLFGRSIDDKNEEMQFYEEPNSLSSPAAGSLAEGISSVNEAGVSKQKLIDEVAASYGERTTRTIKIKSAKSHVLSNKEDVGNNTSMSKAAKGPKLVIHLGGRSRNITSPPRSEASSFRKGQDLTSSNGTDDHLKANEYIDRPDTETKFGDPKGKFADAHESVSPLNTRALLGKRSIEDSASDVPASRRNKYSSRKYGEDGPSVSGDLMNDKNSIPSISEPLPKDQKSHLKFKIPKNSNNGNQNSFSLPGKDEITSVKGQRSKRRRPATIEDRASIEDVEDTSQQYEDDTMNEIMDANWILQKLGKDASGKRVEIHKPSNNSWHRGTVIEVIEGTSIVSIDLDDGKAKQFELGKQGIRFVSQKQKR
ncbi:PHD finger family protein [Abeliophyllum distichum]|uniref:PHD finger family protein n=1 Tax=Abeliophyllum distichum TaxID=126358 RepID=A0ABD1RT60_9LAMI